MEGAGFSLSSTLLVLLLEGLLFLLPEPSLDRLFFFFNSFLLTRPLVLTFLLKALDFSRLPELLLGPPPSSLADEFGSFGTFRLLKPFLRFLRESVSTSK